MKYCVFGGSFDPPHEGHRHLARAAADALEFDKVIWVPAQDPPLKAAPGTPFRHRLAMATLAASDMPGHEVSDIEARLPTPSYSIRTIKALKEEFGPDQDWHFLIGADNWAIFPTWHRPQEVMAEVTLVVYPRRGHPFGPFPKGVVGLPLPEYDAASRSIRHALESGQEVSSAVLPDSVAAYIRSHALYSPEPV